MQRIFSRIGRLVRHRWAELYLSQRIPPLLLDQLEALITASEQHHTGQLRICIEAGLPWSYIWRDASARERALSLFGKLRVWDTEDNNGALIYLLLADHAIEVVADRALHRRVSASEWQAVLQGVQQDFRRNAYADGLAAVLERLSSLLVQGFPRSDSGAREDDLPNAPVVQGRIFKDL
ncbi:TPM domain-containing protein [Comamonas sp. GB3 AK4-5]|uniref:TPM domain-containing protein n=1 Tax=Comamonas sp. GB3 AK4-5 TaxID=3231487 RepID=UPI00351F42B8